MKRSGLTILLLACVLFQVNGQKLDLSLGFGSYRVPNQIKFELPKQGFNMNIGLMYQLSDHWEMGTVINHSVFNFDRASLAATPLSFGDFITSGRVKSDHLYFTFQRKVIFPYQIEASLGAGIGGYIETSENYVAGNFDEERGLYTSISWNRDIETGIHFPLTYAVKKIIANKVSLGIQGGIFLDKNLNTRGIFIGPKAGIFL
ncbi:hypothetical protein P872_23855 [Rhodonellum psychrophilum GCM71 = DSM 17998]|uniref:Outer membrane protein beta-barrel domain-containing protein n=2 Tax=Rhodonellum TaxID=336827 RepID=U5C963_9BACT|nr:MULTISPECIES: hypothetical protein [Rhodonellum]ERM84747.1 hypothetical protein P872_23855 [Rhodonellum psychrophilum GCM71 = DSM 17998]MDO9551281.1 hypothetical protein [Rhodonellum sp.]SDZ12230.1 hypothetical protein SAMN05444412_10666 [Rhodonellum ikkaensis]